MTTTLARRRLLALPMLGALLLLQPAAQAATVTGSGRQATESRTLPEFQAIRLGGSMDLQVRQGPVQSVQLQADDNLLPLLETVVENTADGATLKVRWKDGQSLSTRSKVVVSVVLPRLNAIAAAGAGDVRVDAFNTPALKLSLAGSGDVKLNGLGTEDLQLSLSGSGDVAGTGKATRLKVQLAGSGDVQLAELQADEVRISIAGSGDAAVNAQKTLDVSIAGSGDVSYTGNPAVRSKVAGSGSVTRR